MMTPHAPRTRGFMTRLLGVLFAALAVVGSASAQAQAWPARPVRIVVVFPPGGATDIYARLLAQGLQEAFDQNFVVENRAGAAGVIGFDHIAKSAPDGYTLGLGLGAMTIMPSLRSNLPFDPVRDFAPISIMLYAQNVLIVNQSVPANNLKELIAYAKANPGKLNYASSGIGATPHLSIELLKTMAGIDINHVPYKGDAPAVTDLLGGQVQMYCSTIGGSIQYIRQGRVKAFAVTGRRRSAALPELPTMEEAGLPGYEVVSWYGLIAPAGTPRDIVNRLNAAVVKTVATPAVREKIIASGSDPATNSPEEFRALIRDNVERYGQIVRAAGIKPE